VRPSATELVGLVHYRLIRRCLSLRRCTPATKGAGKAATRFVRGARLALRLTLLRTEMARGEPRLDALEANQACTRQQHVARVKRGVGKFQELVAAGQARCGGAR
jgi:hypothetical protein